MATTLLIKDLIRLGCNVKLTEKYTSLALKEFARLASSNNAHLTINGKGVTSLTLKDIARIGGNNVTIEI